MAWQCSSLAPYVCHSLLRGLALLLEHLYQADYSVNQGGMLKFEEGTQAKIAAQQTVHQLPK